MAHLNILVDSDPHVRPGFRALLSYVITLAIGFCLTPSCLANVTRRVGTPFDFVRRRKPSATFWVRPAFVRRAIRSDASGR